MRIVVSINLINVILLIIFTFRARKRLVSLFRRVRKKTWFTLLVIVLVALFLRVWYMPHFHRVYIDEFWNMEAGKNLIMEGVPTVCHYANSIQTECMRFAGPISWHVFIGLVFLVFGVNNAVLMQANALIGAFSVPLIFFVTYVWFKREEVALFSSVLLAFLPLHIIWSTNVMNNVYAIFFVLLSLALLLSCIRTGSRGLYAAAILSFLYTIQIRSEYVLLAVPFGLLILFSKDKRFYRRLVHPMSLIYVALFLSFMKQLSWKAMDPGNTLYTLGLLRSQLSEFLSLIDGEHFLPVVILVAAFLGALTMLQRDRKVWGVNVIWILLFLFFYNIWDRTGQMRYFLIILIPTIIFSSYGVSATLQRLRLGNATLIVLPILCLAFIPGIHMMKQGVASFDLKQFESTLPELMEQEISPDCYVITEYPPIIHSTTNLKSVSTESVLEQPGLVSTLQGQSGCVLFFYDIACVDDDFHVKEHCTELLGRYTATPYRSYNHLNITFTLYRIGEQGLPEQLTKDDV
jgi:hypothetical protein